MTVSSRLFREEVFGLLLSVTKATHWRWPTTAHRVDWRPLLAQRGEHRTGENDLGVGARKPAICFGGGGWMKTDSEGPA